MPFLMSVALVGAAGGLGTIDISPFLGGTGIFHVSSTSHLVQKSRIKYSKREEVQVEATNL
jgi:hypothetical protein